MSSKTPTEKISKTDLLACKYIKNAIVNNGKIEFVMQIMAWQVRDGNAVQELLEVSCPDVEMISLKSFSPSHYKDIPLGFWIQGLINKESKEDEAKSEYPLYDSLMDQSLHEFKKEVGDAALDLAFIELAIKALRK